MAKKVEGELYESITGQLFEIGRQLRQPNGYPFDPENLQDALQNIVNGVFNNEPAFRFNKRKDGWILVEDNPLQKSVSELEIVSFLKRGENSISGERIRQRAAEMGGNFGQREAEYLLNHQEEIPVSWRQYYLVFPGTVWRYSDGSLGVPYLDWGCGRWSLRFSFLGWNSDGRLLRSRK